MEASEQGQMKKRTIARERAVNLLKNPDAQLISLGIGDTTEPIPDFITSAWKKRSDELSKGYSGYGPEQGEKNVFGSNVIIAVRDPTYPVSRNANILKLQGGYLFPEIAWRREAHKLKYPDAHVISLKVGDTTEPIPEVIMSAMVQRSYVLSTLEGYSGYGAEQGEKVALEISSFSKYAGFAGVRLGWTVVPKELLFSDGFPVANDFNRIICTCFNGASNIAQAGGLACLSPKGPSPMLKVVDYYKKSTEIMMDTFNSLDFKVYGGKNALYVWVHFPGQKSWDVVSEILEKTHVVTTPGSGVRPAGEGFIWVSAFGHRNDTEEACKRFKQP